MNIYSDLEALCLSRLFPQICGHGLLLCCYLVFQLVHMCRVLDYTAQCIFGPPKANLSKWHPSIQGVCKPKLGLKTRIYVSRSVSPYANGIDPDAMRSCAITNAL